MENKLTRLAEIAQQENERRSTFFLNENYSFERAAYSQTLSNWTRAWSEYLNNKNIEKAKAIFNESGFIDLKRAELFNHRILDMQNPRDNLCAVVLSDNQNLINKYSEINYLIKYNSNNKDIEITFRDFAKKGELVAIFSLTILNFLRKDLVEIKNSIETFKKVIETKKYALTLLPDFEFLESLSNGNKDTIKSKIEFFLTKKLHKQRMRDEILLDDYISLPAILYLKLAWILGFEIEINNKLIPMDLMPIKPLLNYDDTYLELFK